MTFPRLCHGIAVILFIVVAATGLIFYACVTRAMFVPILPRVNTLQDRSEGPSEKAVDLRRLISFETNS